MKKTIRQILEANMPKTDDDMEVQECMEEAMGQYPELGDMKVPMKDNADDEDEMDEGYNKMPEGYGDDDMDPSTGIKHAFKAAMMKVLDDDSLDTAGKLAKLKMILAVSDKAMEAMGGGASAAMDAAAMPAMEESYKKQIAGLQTELDRSRCQTLLVESCIEVSDVRIKALMALKESERSDLTKTWKSGNVSNGRRPVRTGSVMQESAAVSYPQSTDDFKRLLS